MINVRHRVCFDDDGDNNADGGDNDPELSRTWYSLIFDLERHPKVSFDGGEECYLVHSLYDSTAYSLDTA